MNYSLATITKLSFVLLVTILLTACPSPGKVKKVIQLNENLKLNEKFEKLFIQSVNRQKTNLLFNHVLEHESGSIIYLDLKSGTTNPDWQEDLISFQKELKQTNTKYQVVTVYNNGVYLDYTSENLEVYERAFELFEKNLEQIKENRIDDLSNTMGYTRVKSESVSDLFNYITITNLKNAKLIAYPSDEIFGDDRTIFKLEASKNTTLYFSYVMHEEQVYLTSVDLNNISGLINISNFLGKIKK